MPRITRLSVIAASLISSALGVSVSASAQDAPSAYSQVTIYDISGKTLATIGADPDGSGALGYPATRNTYDSAGRVVRTDTGELKTWSDTPSEWGDSFTVSKSVIYTYDALDRVTSTTDDSNSQFTQYSYNTNGLLQCTAVRMDATQWSSQSDACQPQTSSSNGPDRITENEYDLLNRIVQIRKAVGTSLEQAYATYSYTADGKQEYVIDANGNRAQMVYDGFDRLSRWYFPSKTAPTTYAPATQAAALSQAGSVNTADYEEYSYDANGNRLTLRKRDGSTLSYTYDALNRMTKKVVPERSGLASTATRDVYYGYDLQGHQTDARFDSLSGEGLHTVYDGFGRATSNTLTMDGVGRTVSSVYDADSNRTQVTQPDGAYTHYVYDGLDRFQQAWWGWTNGGSENLFATVDYKPNGLRDNIARGSSKTTYGYDAAQRLSSLAQSFNGSAGNLTETMAYNPASQIVQETRSNDAYAYTGKLNVSRSYAVNGLNQYSTVGGQAYCYDANGDLTADGSYVYLYDVENRLVEKRVQTNTDCSALAYTGTLKVSLRYDPMGRLYETVGDVTGTTRMAYDGDNLIAEYNGSGTLLRRYMWGDRTDEPLVWDEGGLLDCTGTHFLAGNHQGSIVATSDCSGNLTRTFAYDEYGMPQASDSAALTAANGARFLYTGQAYQPDLGMYYYKARMYSPTLGRFMQTDPIGYDDQINLYAYVANDPVNRVDPTGMESPCITAGTACVDDSLTFGEVLHRAWTALTWVAPLAIPGVGEEVDGARIVGTVAKDGVEAGTEGAVATARVSRSAHPEAASHIERAQAAGHPRELTVERAGRNARRREALRGTPTRRGLDRDEYPPAMFKEGGKGSSVEHINPSDNRGAGASIAHQCRSVPNGGKVTIIVCD